jgi:hypothetical protein
MSLRFFGKSFWRTEDKTRGGQCGARGLAHQRLPGAESPAHLGFGRARYVEGDPPPAQSVRGVRKVAGVLRAEMPPWARLTVDLDPADHGSWPTRIQSRLTPGGRPEAERKVNCKRIAVVGARALTAALRLAQRGYKVTVFRLHAGG